MRVIHFFKQIVLNLIRICEMRKHKIIQQFVYLLLLVLAGVSCDVNPQKSLSEETNIYLDSLEVLFVDVPNWLATVYDKQSGGFYHNAIMPESNFIV